MTFAECALRLCALAARALHWRPHEFWAATPAELACVLTPDPGTEPMDRAALAALMERDNG